MSHFTAAQQRHGRRVVMLSLIYAVLLTGAVYLFTHQLVSGAAAWATAILPGLATSGFFLLHARYLVEETDEYQRMLQMRQLLIGTGILLTFSVIWGFLEGFGLVGHTPAWNWAVIWFVGVGIGAVVNILVERSAA
jgi:MFS family permease